MVQFCISIITSLLFYFLRDEHNWLVKFQGRKWCSTWDHSLQQEFTDMYQQFSSRPSPSAAGSDHPTPAATSAPDNSLLRTPSAFPSPPCTSIPRSNLQPRNGDICTPYFSVLIITYHKTSHIQAPFFVCFSLNTYTIKKTLPLLCF